MTTSESSTTMKYAIDVRPSTQRRRVVVDGVRTFVISSAPSPRAASSGRICSGDEQPDARRTRSPQNLPEGMSVSGAPVRLILERALKPLLED
jgi:hypothetical protein